MRFMRGLGVGLAALVVGWGAGSVRAAERGSTAAPPATSAPGTTPPPVAGSNAAPAPAPLNGADQEIIMELHHANQKEVAAGRLAEQRAASAQVKDFGATLVRDHGAADDKLVALARRRGMNEDKLARPYDASAHGALATAKMRALQGAAFDREFTTRMIGDHQKTIDQVAASRRLASDAELRALLDEIVPTLQRHHATAHALAPTDNGHAAEAPNIPAGDRPGMGDSAPSTAAPVSTPPVTRAPAR